MNSRHIDRRRQLDALTNRGGVICLWVLLMVMGWIFWMQFIVDYDIEPDALIWRTIDERNLSYDGVPPVIVSALKDASSEVKRDFNL